MLPASRLNALPARTAREGCQRRGRNAGMCGVWCSLNVVRWRVSVTSSMEAAIQRLEPSSVNIEKLRVATLHGRLPTSPGSLAHKQALNTRPVRYETFLSNLRILRKTSNAALAALRHSHPFLTLAKRIALEPKHIP